MYKLTPKIATFDDQFIVLSQIAYVSPITEEAHLDVISGIKFDKTTSWSFFIELNSGREIKIEKDDLYELSDIYEELIEVLA